MAQGLLTRPAWSCLLIAASPPVDTLSDQLLVAHMAEHLLIGDVAALLLVLGMTGPLMAPLLRNHWVAKLRFLTHPVVAIVAWAVNFYAWHSARTCTRRPCATTLCTRSSTRPS